EIERRNSERCADLDNPASICRAAKLIAKFRFVTIKGDKLVAPKIPYLTLGRGFLGSLGVVAPQQCNLFVTS
ncbi:MAG: hypothetical protein QOD48_2375, partial [Gaiellaceae bacterium]|nr:hypothetical protein [Gaiellaceae bacterium]